MTPIIEAKGITKSFNTHDVLKGVSMAVEKGEVVVIIGPSGSGKSTFLRTLNRLTEPSGGDVYFDGKKITDPAWNNKKVRRRSEWSSRASTSSYISQPRGTSCWR